MVMRAATQTRKSPPRTLFESVLYMFVKSPTQSTCLAASKQRRTMPTQETLPLPRDVVLQHPNTPHLGNAMVAFYLELVER
jgi:hypothetical protein